MRFDGGGGGSWVGLEINHRDTEGIEVLEKRGGHGFFCDAYPIRASLCLLAKISVSKIP